MSIRKILTTVFISILALTMCFSLAGCDEEENDPEQKEFSNFELYHGERYLKEYTYFYTRLYKYDEKYETYRRVYTNWDAVYPGNPDDQGIRLSTILQRRQIRERRVERDFLKR